jgi:hypothetical protein
MFFEFGSIWIVERERDDVLPIGHYVIEMGGLATKAR